MIAYKWVIEKEGKYYSLINFGIDNYIRNQSLSPYELNHSYNSVIDLSPEHTAKIKRFQTRFSDLPGYHFWDTPYNFVLERWNRFLFWRGQPTINAVLKCKINAIILMQPNYQGEGTRIIANEFKPIEVIKIYNEHPK